MNDSITVQLRLVKRSPVQFKSVESAGGEFPSLRPGTYPRAAESPSPVETRDVMMPATRQGWAA